MFEECVNRCASKCAGEHRVCVCVCVYVRAALTMKHQVDQ